MKKLIFYLCICMLLLHLISCKKEEPRVLPMPWEDGKEQESTSQSAVSDMDEAAYKKEKPSVLPMPWEDTMEQEKASQSAVSDTEEAAYVLICQNGTTTEERILAPLGYKRITAAEDSLLAFTRGMSLKPNGSPVLLFNGNEKPNQKAHAAVYDMDIGQEDLQQCADSIIRVYSEYLWFLEEYNRIGFHLTNGFYMEYSKWKEGSRLSVQGNKVSWKASGNPDRSYDCFRDYLKQIFIYAGTLSLNEESFEIEAADIQAGDMFIYGGSPGHCVMVVDTAEDSEGNRCFLLAQGYMPAQDFHILNNPLHSNDPWYYVSELTYPLQTPQYTFQEGSLRRWSMWE